MKKQFLKIVSLSFIVSFLFGLNNTNAQTGIVNNNGALVISTQVPELLEACRLSQTYTITLTNNTGSTISDIHVLPVFLSGITYEVGSVVPPSGTTITIGTGAALEFIVSSTIPNTGSFSFSFNMKADCGIVPTIRTLYGQNATAVTANHSTRVEYKIGANAFFDTEPDGSESYAIALPKLNLVSDDITRSLILNINDIRTRKFKVINGGNGTLEALRIKITYDEGVVLVSLKDGNGTIFQNVVPPVTADGKTTYILSVDNFSTATGTNPTLFELNESIELFEEIQINKCLAASDGDGHITEYIAQWGCSGIECDDGARNDEDNAFITILNGEPSISIDLTQSTNKLNPCNSSTVSSYYFTYRNNGIGGDELSDRARDFRLFFSYVDNIVHLQSVKLLNGSTYINLPFTVQQIGGINDKLAIVDFSQFTSDPDGADIGADDLDDDGLFNDLASGKMLNLMLEYTTSCFAIGGSAVCDQPYYWYPYISNYMRYNDACLSYGIVDQTYSVSWTQYLDLKTNAPPIIEGPVDLLDEQVVNYTVSNNIYIQPRFFDQFECGNTLDNFSATIQLPEGYVFDTDVNGDVLVTWDDYSNPPINIASTVSTDLRTLEVNQGGIYGFYSFPVKLVCATQGNPEFGEIEYKYYYSCNNSCGSSCKTIIGCAKYEIYAHCPVVLGGGGGGSGCFRTTSLEVERKSLGKVEPTLNPYYTFSEWNAASQVLPTQSGLKLDRVMEFDQIELKANGFFQASGGYTASVAKLRLQYKSPYTSPLLNIFEVESVNVQINSGAICTVPLSAVVTTPPSLPDDVYVLDITIPTSCKSSYVNGDVIFVTVNVKVPFIDPEIYAQNSDYGLIQITKLRARHYGLDASSQLIQGCESFGDYCAVFRNYVSSVPELHAGIYCDGGSSFLAISNTYLSGVDYFPGEFRPFSYLKNFSSEVNNGFNVRSNAATLKQWLEIPGSASYYYNLPQSYQITPVGDISATQTNSWMIGDNQSYDYFTLDVIQSCQVTSEITSTNFDIARYAYTNNQTIINQYTQSRTSLSRAADYTVADLTILIEPIQNGYKKEVIWPVSICNNTFTYLSTPKTWLAFEPSVQGITIKKLIVNGVDVFPYKTYLSSDKTITMFELGQLDYYGSCKDVKVVGEYTVCVENRIDDIIMRTGWHCDFYPQSISLTDLGCMRSVKSTVLKLRYKTTDLLSETRKLGEEEIEVCEDITYEVKYISTGNANLNSLKLNVDFPEGVSYVENSFYYDYGTLVNQPLGENPNFTNTGFLLDLSKLGTLPLSNNDPPGELPGVFASNSENVLTLRFNLQMNCDVDGGLSSIRIRPTAITNCGQLNSAGDFQLKVLLKGLNPLDKTSTLISNVSLFDEATGRAHFDVKVTNLGDNNLYAVPLENVKRYMVLKLPVGFDCIVPSNAEFTETEDANTLFYFRLDDLTPLQAQFFSVVIQKTTYNADANGSTIHLNASTIMRLEAVECTALGEVCNLKATTSEDDKPLIIPSSRCDACISTFAPREGEKYIVGAWVRVQGASPSLLGFSQANMSLYFKGPNMLVGPLYPSGVLIDGWQRIEREIIIPIGTTEIEFRFNNTSGPSNVLFDDIRVHPVNSNMKAFVYDPHSLRLSAELDENNYATFYEYDQEGGLIRVKKETEKGVMTIQESRSNNIKK